MIVTICYFIKSLKPAFILIQCNTPLSKNYVAHLITVVSILCDRLNLRKKQDCLRSLALFAYEISRRTRIFHEFTLDNKTLKTFVEF